jgi:PadR family transcriptional regulator PadR
MTLRRNVEATLALWTREYKKGFLSYFVLMLLKDRPTYGFELIGRLSEMTRGEMVFQESGIYHILNNLNRKKFVTAQWRRSDKGPKRKYYHITDSGEQLIGVFTEQSVLPIMSTLRELVKQHYPGASPTTGRKVEGFRLKQRKKNGVEQ